MSACKSLNTIPQKGSGDIASRAKRKSHGAPYGLSLQLDIVSQRMPLLGKVPGRGWARCPAVPQGSVLSFHLSLCTGICSSSLGARYLYVCMCVSCVCGVYVTMRCSCTCLGERLLSSSVLCNLSQFLRPNLAEKLRSKISTLTWSLNLNT